MNRRELITLLGGAAAAWPLAARAQQPAMPVIGFLRSTTEAGSAQLVAALRQGLKEAGFVEGQDVAIDFRWGDDQPDRLPGLAADLVRRQPAVIIGNVLATRAAMAATTAIPIVFVGGSDPIRTGLVANLNRPGGNVTGVVFTSSDLTAAGAVARAGSQVCRHRGLGPARRSLGRIPDERGGGGRSKHWPASLDRESRRRT
jgi:ABC-type uncharacterized transport system substrate-binding protein